MATTLHSTSLLKFQNNFTAWKSKILGGDYHRRTTRTLLELLDGFEGRDHGDGSDVVVLPFSLGTTGLAKGRIGIW
ncbi:acyl-CoA synthetase [Sesbania bispinosa]|nr:acyl-CoA synthetase [Sesbania bispinosa]